MTARISRTAGRVVAAVVLLVAARAGAAQGTLSSQGFGYPPGQLSARGLATGGATAELDPQSPINPAALASWGRPGIYFQYSPEFRRVLAGGSEDRATLARFPLAVAALSATQRVTVAISYSTLLDRTWETNSSLLVGTGDDTSTATATFRSTGAINDVRLAAAYELRPTLRLGLGIHALSGENRTERALAASDSSAFSSTREQQAFSFSGKGLSAGLDWRPSRSLAIAASGRIGGTLTAWRGDTAVRRADVPTRAGASVAYNGFGGSLLVARADWEGWSRLRGLSSSAVETRDAWELSVGTETRGPSWFGTNLPLRGGVHWRTLPFALPGTGDVREVTGALGAGLPLARGRAQADFTVERAFRSFSGNAPGNASGGASDVRERAWTLSFGFGVRL